MTDLSRVPEKMVRLAKIRRTYLPFVFVLTLLLSATILEQMVIGFAWWIAISAIGILWFGLFKVADFILQVFAELYVYGGKMDELQKDVYTTIKEIGSEEDKAEFLPEIEELVDQHPAERAHKLGQVSVKIVDTPDKHIGVFKGCHFYEWLILQNMQTNTMHRVVFDGTVDTMNNPVIPDDCFLIEPGLLYKQVPQVTPE